jgi:CheY-like chemotaxis protein
MNRRILVVDDDHNIRSMLQAFLEDEAYEVDTASDGLVAWEKLAHQREGYEAILLDLSMPRLGGLQLIRALQSQGERFWLPIIALSGDQGALQQAAEMGIHRALVKPFDLEAVLDLIVEEGSLCGVAA